MIRLLFITDYTEQFSYRMLKGITNRSDKSEKWVINRMLPSYMRSIGLKGAVEWAKRWKADVVIGQFAPGDDLSLFERNGIIVIAQDYIQVFPDVPNITADYQLTGKMAAEHFLTKGYSNFAFFGYKGVCWSEKRFEGFRDKIVASGYGVFMTDRNWTISGTTILQNLNSGLGIFPNLLPSWPVMTTRATCC